MKKYLFLILFFITACSKQEEKVSYVGLNVDDVKIKYEFKYVDSGSSYNQILSEKEVDGTYFFEVSNANLLFEKNNVDELGRVPIMMYHGIFDTSETVFGGNIDKMGYNRSAAAFIKDLQFYYNSGYRAIRLKDYVEGRINVPLGKSPIILTFDDGNVNNIRVIGKENGKLIIDPKSAVGIMEDFKKKHPDFNITATFFLHSALFSQKYNKEILNWLIENGYDIGNHTYSHSDLSSISKEEVEIELKKMYNLLNDNIGNKYVDIVSLPFGKPYDFNHENFDAILKNASATLRVGWEANTSPFSKNFNKLFIKRIRAYDNNGIENDIAYEFSRLEKNKFISDGIVDLVTIKKNDIEYLNTDLDINTYGGLNE